MSQNDELIKLIQDNDVETFKLKTRDMANIDSANYKIKIHTETNVNQENIIPEDGLTLLHVAAFYDAMDCFMYLHKDRQISLRKLSSHSFYPLHYSCWSGCSEISLYILTCDPSQATSIVEDSNFVQLLYCAIIGGNIQVIQALFDKGANISQPPNFQSFLIDRAISLHNRDILLLLLEHCKSSASGANNDDPPLIKTILNHNAMAFDLLYSGKDDISKKIPTRPDQNIIRLICENDQINTFKNILIKKVIPDAKELNLEPTDPKVPGICFWACSYMDVDVARELFKLPNCNLNRIVDGKTGPSSLIYKQSPKVVDMLDLLIESGFNINDTHNDKVPTLLESFLSAPSKNVNAIRLLVNKGAKIDSPCILPQYKSKYKNLYDMAMNIRSTNAQSIKDIFKDALNKQ